MLEDVEVSIDRVQIGEEAIHSDGNLPIREETTNPINESLIETKNWQFSEKTVVPNAIKGLGDIERDHSALTTGF